MARKSNAISEKQCTICKKMKPHTDFFKSQSPFFANDERVPICTECVYKTAINDNGTLDYFKLNDLFKNMDKPYFKDVLQNCFTKIKEENSYITEEELPRCGKKALGLYFRTIGMKQYGMKSYSDSVEMNFLYDKGSALAEEEAEKNEVIYSKTWCGNYTKEDLNYLDNYYAGLERDYKIITENHRDYARKIAKASLQMDKAFNEMMNGFNGAEQKYKNAREAFDTLSKSAKFSESTRSVNDVGISSFSKIASMVEGHNWIPEHKPMKKDQIDELIDYLSTITKSI